MIIEPFCPTRIKRAIDLLESNGYEILLGNLTSNTKEIYRSGTIKERVEELHNLVLNDKVDIIMVSIGGQNTASLLEYIDYDLLIKHPKIYIGYSDATSLLHAINVKTGLRCLYGMSLSSSFGEIGYFSKESLKQLNQVLNNQKFCYSKPEYYTNQYVDWETQTEEKTKYLNEFYFHNAKNFSGRVVGGNLTTLSVLAGTEYLMPRQDGDVLYLEVEGTDIGMIEKYFVHLKMIGYFNKLSGIILGKNEFIKDYGLNRSLITILEEIIDLESLPVYYGFDAAHTNPSTLIELGCKIKVTKDGELCII